MINRRKFLTLAGSGAMAWIGNSIMPAPIKSFASSSQTTHNDAEADLVIKMRSMPGRVPIFSGPKTDVWMYRAEVLKGDPESITNMGDESYLGPIIRVKKGETLLDCRSCGALSRETGEPLYQGSKGQSQMNCPYCGNPVAKQFRFCPFCGKPI